MTLDRTKVPASLSPVPFEITPPVKATLSNGLRLVIVESERIPFVSYRLAFFSGDANDPDGRPGVTSAMTSLMMEGTENYSSRDLAEKIERLGASLSVSSSDDFTIVSASALSAYTNDIIEMMAEVVLRPTFPDNEVDLYKRNTLEHLKFQRSQPSFLVNEQLARILYGKHPYAITAPSPEDVEKLEAGELARLRQARCIPNNAVLVVVGDMNAEEIVSDLEKHFSDWAAGEAPVTFDPPPPVRTGRTITIVDRPGSAQSNIVISDIAAKRSDPDYFPVIVMNQILGAGASSRVFMNLREEKGYTYGAYTRFDMKKLSGDFEATAEVRTAVTGDSLKEFFYELERIRTEPVSEEELRDAKAYLTGVFPIRAETQEGLTGLILNQQLYSLPDDFLETYRDNVNAVTITEVQRVAEKYVKPATSAIVIVGDASEMLSQLDGYASSFEVFDTDGKPKDLSEFASADDGEPADLAGEWELSIELQGQAMPVKLTLSQEGNSVSGKLVTMLGEGEIKNGAVAGSKMTATATAEMQGQAIELLINGKLVGLTLSGTITTEMFPEALSFSGQRA